MAKTLEDHIKKAVASADSPSEVIIIYQTAKTICQQRLEELTKLAEEAANEAQSHLEKIKQ